MCPGPCSSRDVENIYFCYRSETRQDLGSMMHIDGIRFQREIKKTESKTIFVSQQTKMLSLMIVIASDIKECLIYTQYSNVRPIEKYWWCSTLACDACQNHTRCCFGNRTCNSEILSQYHFHSPQSQPSLSNIFIKEKMNFNSI